MEPAEKIPREKWRAALENRDFQAQTASSRAIVRWWRDFVSVPLFAKEEMEWIILQQLFVLSNGGRAVVLNHRLVVVKSTRFCCRSLVNSAVVNKQQQEPKNRNM
jgi:hypothetical protein